MGLFGASSIYDADVEKATSEKNTTDKWDLIMEICDKVGHNPANAKECLRSIMKRLNHNDPHVVMRAITLLDACVNNCGKSFHLEIASRDFETEFKRLLTKHSSPEICQKLRLSLKKWAEGDFKSDPQLNLIPSLYMKLKSEGYDFSEGSQPQKKTVELSKDPNVVSSQQEEDDIAKAIELSLKETKNSPKTSSYKTSNTSNNTQSSLYPSMSLNSGGASSAVAAPEPRKVRALYDFEAAEDNELTFFAGEVLLVLDDSDPNWWKGQNQRGEGLFPSNFVSADLSAELEAPIKSDKNSSKKFAQFSEENGDHDRKDDPIHINEDTIDRLLHLLHEADPEDPSQDTDDMLRLEHQVNQMHPLIDQELERVDRKHAQLTQLSSDLAEAVGLYHQLMRDDRGYSGGYIPSMAPLSMPPQHMPMYHENGSGPTSMYNPYQMGAMQSALPQMAPPSATPPFHPQNYPGAPQAFHSPVPPQHPQQMHNGHMATNGNSYMSPQAPLQQPPQQPGPPNEQLNSGNFVNQPPPPQHFAMNPNNHQSPSHHPQYNPQQHPGMAPPQMQPGQTILPAPPTNMMPGSNPGMMYQQHPNGPQNIPVYQQQR
ncbi:signal transducing adapter molecule 1 [Culicoides brevitarsis]|uniref:signal transducing adapter molecule 1 n=1 Tax=Culicoides brevitarsis TaxID=469753 RepID=UPI00307CABA0